MDTSLPIVGRRVAKVSFADVVPYLTLDLPARNDEDETERPDYVLQIDGKLRFTASGIGHEVELEVEADAVCLRLLGKTVSRAAALDDGTLHVRFVDGDVLTVESSAYEPWQLNGSDGSLVVSVAGGGLAIWGPSGGGTLALDCVRDVISCACQRSAAIIESQTRGRLPGRIHAPPQLLIQPFAQA